MLSWRWPVPWEREGREGGRGRERSKKVKRAEWNYFSCHFGNHLNFQYSSSRQFHGTELWPLAEWDLWTLHVPRINLISLNKKMNMLLSLSLLLLTPRPTSRNLLPQAKNHFHEWGSWVNGSWSILISLKLSDTKRLMLVGLDEWVGAVSSYSNKQWGQISAYFGSPPNIFEIFH